MSFLSDLAKQKGRSRNQSEFLDNTCYNCKRTGNKRDVRILNCIFAINPETYEDFLYNPSMCNYCLNEICHIFQHDFYLPNEDLAEGYSYVKNNGFFKTTKEKEEDMTVFVLGIRPNMPDDFHVLLIDNQFEKAIDNVYQCLLKGSDKKAIKTFKDLLNIKSR